MRSVVWGAAGLWVLMGAGCGGEDDSEPDTSADSDTTAEVDTDADTDAADLVPTWAEARPIVERRCARCHSADRLSTYRRLETHDDVSRLRSSILDKISESPPRGQRMPLASNHQSSDGCTPENVALNDHRLTPEEHATLVAYLERTDHRDYVDTFEPITAPEVPVLADSELYTSTNYDVLNDGFLTPPAGQGDDFMHEWDYDERDYDQMEDDWFCIRFDPELATDAFLTGLQVGTEIGQIYLNSQVVIDTTGGFTAARNAAEERGQDWYRCDGGLGFNGAVPLWRTVPGGAAVELPANTGLRMEPGWTFVLRADFHTHYDAEEFLRLEQRGEIDYDEGTMTWFDRAWLRARWSSSVDRELAWLTVGPQSAQERDAFAVAPGESTVTYTASLPDDGNYTVFSAEVGMGKHGYAASLEDTSTSTCVASNTDFSPKWIEHTLYGEADAPALDASSVLERDCNFRNTDGETRVWGAEGEATVWGRKERCAAVVFYYEQAEQGAERDEAVSYSLAVT